MLATRLDQAGLAASIEGLVLAPAVHPDDRPHAVLVRVDVHAGRPDHVDDGQPRRVVQREQPALGGAPSARTTSDGSVTTRATSSRIWAAAAEPARAVRQSAMKGSGANIARPTETR